MTWIPVTERMPAPSVLVIVADDLSGVSTASLTVGGYYFDDIIPELKAALE